MEARKPLTDHAFWKEYWRTKHVIFNVPESYSFGPLLKGLHARQHFKNFIEVGGFPGHYAVYALKHLGIMPTLLDYHIVPPVLEKLCALNKVSPSDIELLERDFFQHEPDRQFDIVFSKGFIEHFLDLKDVIGRHLSYCAPGGVVVMTVPNFRGFAGWAQFFWDRPTLRKHNLRAMKPGHLRKVLKSLGVTDYDIFYDGQYGMWLDNYESLSRFNKRLFEAFENLTARASYKIRWKRMFSPALVVVIRNAGRVRS